MPRDECLDGLELEAAARAGECGFLKVDVTGVGEPEQMSVLVRPRGCFQFWERNPLLGRSFMYEDNLAGSAEAVILFYGYWERKWGWRPFCDWNND